MIHDYQFKITFKLNQPFNVSFIQKFCREHPNSKVLVEVQNTKGISSHMIRQLDPSVGIRISGGYDQERIDRYKGWVFDGEACEEYYLNSVIYSRNETIKILEEIEKIEKGLSKDWSDIQKLLYIYDKLKSGIMYDPKYEQKASKDIRTLRGLISKQTVCAGYAIILKEFMDRCGIECEFVRGAIEKGENGGHAWNIVNIDGKKYPIDLTWDNTMFRSGKANTFDWLGKSVVEFSEHHYPAQGEKTQDYKHTLSQIDPEIIKKLYSKMGIGKARDYSSTTYYGVRKDGSKYMVAQVGENTINGENYYRYYFTEISKAGKNQLPIILYSKTNVTHLVYAKMFGEKIPPNYEDAVDSILFSKENILDSLEKHTYYIGEVRKNKLKEKLELVSSYQEISKPAEIRNLFVFPTKRFIRSDGSVLIAQQMYEAPVVAKGINVMRYDIFEMVKENGSEVLKRNTVYTERNFFKDPRQSMVDDYLSRERLDRKVKEAGGYIGYYNENGVRTYNPDLVNFFKNSSRVELTELDKQVQKQTYTMSYEELPVVGGR